MYDIPEESKGQTRLRNRVLGRINRADADHPLDPELHLLLRPLGRLLELPLHQHRRAGGHQRRERRHRRVDDDLKVAGAGAVVDLEEGEAPLPLLAAGLHPPTHGDPRPGEPRAAVGAADDALDPHAPGELLR